MAIKTVNVGAAATDIHTSAGDEAITFISVCNHSAAPVTVDIHVILSGGSPAPSNLFISALEIVADDTYIAYQGNEKLFLSTGDKITVVATVADVTTVILSYVTI